MTRTQRILVVDDEPAIREMLGMALSRGGYRFEEAGDVAGARAAINRDTPALILLDWLLPDQPGIELARSLKQSPETRDIPIIMLTALGKENEKVQGLESGADDYITKPFSPRELLARISAVLRRSKPVRADTVLRMRELALNDDSHRVTVNGTPVDLGPTEYRLLHFFMSHPERVYSRRQLLDMVWGENVYVEERTVDVHIRRLRGALEESQHDQLIQTVRGAGYRFSDRS